MEKGDALHGAAGGHDDADAPIAPRRLRVVSLAGQRSRRIGKQRSDLLAFGVKLLSGGLPVFNGLSIVA